jgi:hypothetical protein
MKFLIASAILLLFVGCKTEIETEIDIVEKSPMIVKTLERDRIKIPQGRMKGELTIDSDNPQRSYLKFFMVRKNRKFRPEVPLKLPSVDVLLGSTDPVKLESKNIGQNFGMMVMRQMRRGDDLFTVTFHDKEFNQSFGQMTFEFEPDTVHFDENKNEFLASYQKVLRKQRALIVKIDGDVDRMLKLSNGFGWLEKTLDHIVNYGGAALISPWAYARYSKVMWMIGESTIEEKKEHVEGIKEITSTYPVIDYFSFVHEGNQIFPMNSSAKDLGLKKNQLRVVFTGACESGAGSEWLKNYSAVAAAGTRKVSASVLFQFGVLRRFVYGFSFEDSVVNSYNSGVAKARALEWVSFADKWQEEHGVIKWKSVDDMLEQSELLYSYTAEMPASEVGVSHSAILSGKADEIGILERGSIQTLAERADELYIQNESELN